MSDMTSKAIVTEHAGHIRRRMLLLMLLDILLMFGCVAAPGATQWQMPWIEDANRVYEGGLFDDATNLRLPVGSVLGFDIKARAADFDGDGDPDVLLSVMYTANKLLMNTGADKRFHDETLLRLPQHDRPSEDIGIGDIDGDGDIDAVVVNGQGGHELYINDGHGRFTDEGQRLPVSSGLRVALFDADGDHDLDLVIGNYEGPPLLLINDGSGHFSERTSEALSAIQLRVSALAALDADGDGDLDLVIAGPRRAQLLINDGSGRFSAAAPGQFPELTDQDPWDLAVCDVTGDHRPDLIFADQGLWTKGVSLQNRLVIAQPDGRFVDETSTRLPPDREHTLAIRCLDVDGDGDSDLITGTFRMDVWGRRHDAPFHVYLNNGVGKFRQADEVLPETARGNGRDIEPADFNGDGRIDLYLTSRGGPDLLLMGTSRSVPRSRPARNPRHF